MTRTIPLFPLNSVLFPKGRLSLQIFESRYVDMVRACMRDQSGFGVVLIEKGREVSSPGMKLDIHWIGTYGDIIDWNQLPSGLLGITVEGRQTFRIIESWREDNGLCVGQVEFRQEDSVEAEPVEVGGEFQEYVELLQSLSRHPAVEELRLEVRLENLREIAWRLSELLPISNRDKQSLLEPPDPLERLEKIALFLNAYNSN